MEFSASQIAGLLNGQVVGNPDVTVTGLAKIEEGIAGSLSFLSNPKYEEYIYTTGSSICIVNDSFEPRNPLPSTLTLVKVEDAYACFARLLDLYSQMSKKQPKIEQPSFIAETAVVGEGLYLAAFAYIGEGAKIGNNVTIYPNVFIGENVEIGDDCILFAGAKVYADTKIGARCVIHAGVVIGSDGFGFAPDDKGVFSKVPQIGNVILEDDVEIGANSTIDCATMGSTIIRQGVKIDNLVHLAHNVEVGAHSVMAAQVGVAGSAKIGKHVMVGGQAGVIGHLKVADGVKIAGQSGVGHNVEKEGEILQGSPAFPIGEYKRAYVLFRGLSKLHDRVKALELKLKS